MPPGEGNGNFVGDGSYPTPAGDDEKEPDLRELKFKEEMDRMAAEMADRKAKYMAETARLQAEKDAAEQERLKQLTPKQRADLEEQNKQAMYKAPSSWHCLMCSRSPPKHHLFRKEAEGPTTV